MRKFNKWWNEKGLKNIGLIIAALVLWIFLPGAFFNWIGLILIGMFLGLNWQSLKDLSTVDEKVEKGYEDVKELIEEKIDELKRELVGLKK